MMVDNCVWFVMVFGRLKIYENYYIKFIFLRLFVK